jgi:hypothetical protein
MFMHHATTALFLAALAAWAIGDAGTDQAAASNSTTGGSGTANAVVALRAMLAFQLLSSAATLTMRRIAFACCVNVMLHVLAAPAKQLRGLTSAEVSPVVYATEAAFFNIPHDMRQETGYFLGAGLCICRHLRLPYHPCILKADAVSALTEFLASVNVSVLPEPRNLHLLQQLGQAPPPLPNGHRVAHCTTAPAWRANVEALLRAELPVDRDGANTDTTSHVWPSPSSSFSASIVVSPTPSMSSGASSAGTRSGTPSGRCAGLSECYGQWYGDNAICHHVRHIYVIGHTFSRCNCLLQLFAGRHPLSNLVCYHLWQSHRLPSVGITHTLWHPSQCRRQCEQQQ